MGGKRGCALCGEMIDTGPRGTCRYCARCRKELERQRSRECQARKKEKRRLAAAAAAQWARSGSCRHCRAGNAGRGRAMENM